MKSVVFAVFCLASTIGGGGLGAMEPKSSAVNSDKNRSVPIVGFAQQLNTFCQAKTGYFGPKFFYKLFFAAAAAKAGYAVACDLRKIQDVQSDIFSKANYWPIYLDSAVLISALTAFFMTAAWHSLYSRGAFVSRAMPHIAKHIVVNQEACACLHPELLRGMREGLADI